VDDQQFLSQLFADMESAEVLTIFFPLWRRALVIDTRRAGAAGPYVEVAPIASSIEERLSAIERRHPDLGPVAAILSIPWLKSIGALREMGVFARITARLVAVGMPEAMAQAACATAQRELLAAERQATVALIRGDGYATLWPAD
jgi:hypothetical protein